MSNAPIYFGIAGGLIALMAVGGWMFADLERRYWKINSRSWESTARILAESIEIELSKPQPRNATGTRSKIG